MTFHLGVEDIEPGNWVAWIFEMPGCYARASTRDEAIALAPEAIDEHLRRLTAAGYSTPKAPPPYEIIIAEESRARPYSPDYLINAFFKNDRLPLAECDIEYARLILDLNRKELMETISDLSDEVLTRTIEGEVQKNIHGIIRHIGSAEWWYWDRLGRAFPREERPKEIFELLKVMREFTLTHLSDLVGLTETTVCLDETWSARKLLRRAVWHERVHTLQIKRYLKK